MNIKIVKIFAIIAAVLSVIIITEWIISRFAENRLMDSDFSKNRQTPLLNEIPEINLKEKTEESYADLVNRPLFIKGRRPVDETSPEQTNVKPGSDIFDWQLNGVYTTDQGLSALFSRIKAADTKDRFRKLKENDDLEGWKLAEIHSDKVILKQDDESKELLLSKPKPKELPKTAVQARNPTKKETGKRTQNPARAPIRRNNKNNEPVSQPQSTEDSSENTENTENTENEE